CTVSAVSGHPLVRSLWSSPVLCPQSLVISCTVSAFVHSFFFKTIVWPSNGLRDSELAPCLKSLRTPAVNHCSSLCYMQ
ncbi:unnamed protein product, partial [Staurois parvus]